MAAFIDKEWSLPVWLSQLPCSTYPVMAYMISWFNSLLYTGRSFMEVCYCAPALHCCNIQSRQLLLLAFISSVSRCGLLPICQFWSYLFSEQWLLEEYLLKPPQLGIRGRWTGLSEPLLPQSVGDVLWLEPILFHASQRLWVSVEITVTWRYIRG